MTEPTDLGPSRPPRPHGCGPPKASRQGPARLRELAGNPEYPAEMVWAGDHDVAFLARYSTLLGHTLVAPRAHREQVTGDFPMQEYLSLQRLVYQIGEALRGELPTERLYIMSLGSQSGTGTSTGMSPRCRPGCRMRSSSSPPSPGTGACSPSPDADRAELAGRIGARVAALRRDAGSVG